MEPLLNPNKQRLSYSVVLTGLVTGMLAGNWLFYDHFKPKLVLQPVKVEQPTPVKQTEPPNVQEIVLAPKKESPKQPVTITINKTRELGCLARNIFYEAGVESNKGKMAVAQVTHNRLKSGRWGNTYCSVVYAKRQFSWTSVRNIEKPTGPNWQASLDVARQFIAGKRMPSIKGMFYHKTSINPPVWTDNMIRTHVIGRHVFYRLKSIS